MIGRLRRHMPRMGAWRRRRRLLGDVDTMRSLRRRSRDFPRLCDEIRDMGTDNLKAFANGYRREGGFALQQHPEEFAGLLLCLRERRPYANYVEIESASGGQCLALYRQVGWERGLVLDDGKHPRAGEQLTNFSQIPGLERFIGDSHSAAANAFLREGLTGPIDLAFVDGDHSYEGVWQDIRLVLEFGRPGTLVVLHDTVAVREVESVWLEALERGALVPVAEFVGRSRGLGIGVGAVPPAHRFSAGVRRLP